MVRPQIRGFVRNFGHFWEMTQTYGQNAKNDVRNSSAILRNSSAILRNRLQFQKESQFVHKFVQFLFSVRPSTFILRPILALSSHHELKIAAGCAKLHAFVAMWMVFGYLHIGRVVQRVRYHWPKVKESCHPTRQSHLWVLPASCQ